MAEKKPTGNRVLAGAWAELWLNGAKVFILSKVSAKITANREDVQIGQDMDSKITGLKGEGSFTVKKVYSAYKDVYEAWARGEDIRSQLIAKLADPDAANKQMERYSFDNVWFNELPVVDWEVGKVVEAETPFGFTPTDMQILDQIA